MLYDEKEKNPKKQKTKTKLRLKVQKEGYQVRRIGVANLSFFLSFFL